MKNPNVFDLAPARAAGSARARRSFHRCAAGMVLAVALGLVAAPALPRPQSLTGSRAASERIAEGSVLIASGAAELLSTGGELAVVSVRKTGRGVELVLRPVESAFSGAAELSAAVTAELSATVTVEVASAAWEAAVEAARTSGRAIEDSGRLAGGLVVAVPLATSAVATASAVGTALVVGEVVLGIVAEEELAGMLGREAHRCAGHAP